jgi:hypothetical protein
MTNIAHAAQHDVDPNQAAQPAYEHSSNGAVAKELKLKRF